MRISSGIKEFSSGFVFPMHSAEIPLRCARATLVPRDLTRVNRCRTAREKKEKKKRGIYVYNRNSGVSCGDFAAREGERGGSGSQPRNWRKTVANLQARIPRSQQCVILLKRGGTRDIGASVSEVQMENETITQRTLRRDRSARGNGVGKKISRDRYARVSDAFSVHFGAIRSRIRFGSLRRERERCHDSSAYSLD